MTCEECDKCREMGYKFCIRCGESFTDAPVPGPMPEEEKGTLKESTLNKFVVPSMVLIFVACIASVAVILMDYGPTMDLFDERGMKLWIYFFAFFDLPKLTGMGAVLFWVFISLTAMVCTAVFLWKSKDAFKFDSPEYMENTKRTPLFWMGLLFGSSLLLEVILNGIFTMIGMGIETPGGLVDLTLEEALMLFTEAAVWEELMFRVLLFGLPVVIVGYALKEKGSWKHLFGGFGSSKLTVVLLIFSTILFSVAHADSWGFMKIFTVAIGGFMLGYVYMRFGLYASIVCHMLNDFSMVWMLGINDIFASLLLIAILGLGLVNLPLLYKKTMRGIRKVKSMPLTCFSFEAIPVTDGPEEEVQEDESEEIRDDQDSQGPRTD